MAVMTAAFQTFLVALLVAGIASVASTEPMQRQAQQSWVGSTSMCGCLDCNSAIYASMADNHRCIDRIWFLIGNGMTEEEACSQVSDEFPTICGPYCHPARCDGREEEDLEPIPVSATVPGEDLQPIPVSASVPQEDLQPIPVSATVPTSSATYCGCPLCTLSIWNRMVAGYACGARIDYLQHNEGTSTNVACSNVALQYPSECGVCNANTCQDAPPSNSIPLMADHSPPNELYCYPPAAMRTRWENVWEKYQVEVKEGEVCGPSDNMFSRAGVSLSGSDLKLTFGKQTDGRWYASEVRILPPPSDHFEYGRYSFSVKSIQVVDAQTKAVVSYRLPVSLILGLFTWDETESFISREQESWMHEVDIEISQWNVPNNEDIQFLVQPPGDPQKYRFFSGAEGSAGVPAYNQAPNTYDFDWKPAEIAWHSTAGGGHSFTYSTQTALNANQPDYTQCLPANVEVRINLWHLFGSSAPFGMQDNHRVEVVIDNFTFEPSGVTGVPVGGICSKDCHCGGTPFQCIGNRCTRVGGGTRRRLEHVSNEDSANGWKNSLPVDILSLAALAVVVGAAAVRRFVERPRH
jgi:hypothetical protein